MGLRALSSKIEFTVGNVRKSVSYPANVEKIDLSGQGYIYIDLAQLRQFPSLRKLDLRVNRFSPAQLEPLKNCRSLTSFSLTSTQFRQIDLTPLSDCTLLEDIRLWLRDLREFDLRFAASLQEMRRLDLMTTTLEAIDLEPLRKCSVLESLSLKMNTFQSIDLTPLRSCMGLQEIDLMMNRLNDVDLSPLSGKANLRHVGLGGNGLGEVNLAPLGSCPRLQKIDLTSCDLRTLDLYPLFSCGKLSELYLKSNSLSILDITPLLSRPDILADDACKMHSWIRMEKASYQRPVPTDSWRFLRSVAELGLESRRIQHDFVYAMGLAKLGFFARDLEELLLSIPSETTMEEAREQVVEVLLFDVIAAIDGGESATGFQVEEFYKTNGDIAARTQEIFELRKREIQNLVLELRNDKVDLKPLWLTAYGYEVLSALGEHLSTDLGGFERLKKSFEKIGFTLKTGDASTDAVKMPNETKQVIWWLAENTGRQWAEVRST